MYIGIASFQGKKVHDEDAFMVAMEICTTDDKWKSEFLLEFIKDLHSMITKEDVERFREDLVEWFYSGNWVYKDE